jgi:hypothetical protein
MAPDATPLAALRVSEQGGPGAAAGVGVVRVLRAGEEALAWLEANVGEFPVIARGP